MKRIELNINTLIGYQIIINTTDNPDAIAMAVNRVLRQLIESTQEATKESDSESHE